jgi:hypothetical protein
MLDEIWRSLGGLSGYVSAVAFEGDGALPSAFAVSDLAAAAIGAAGLAAAELVEVEAGDLGGVSVDRRLASYWFGMSLRPDGWQLAPAWDAIAGEYETKDGWIKLHTNAPHHRAAALAVLGVGADREAVAEAGRRWSGEALEAAVVERGGCAASCSRSPIGRPIRRVRASRANRSYYGKRRARNPANRRSHGPGIDLSAR